MSRKSLGKYKVILCNNGEDNCHYCKVKLVFGKKQKGSDFATVDHIVPKRLRGKNSLTNFVLACSLCNSLKGHMEYQKFANKVNSVESRNEYYEKVKQNANRKKEERHLSNVFRLACLLYFTKIKISLSYELRLMMQEIE